MFYIDINNKKNTSQIRVKARKALEKLGFEKCQMNIYQRSFGLIHLEKRFLEKNVSPDLAYEYYKK